jgi:hypothetical protein
MRRRCVIYIVAVEDKGGIAVADERYKHLTLHYSCRFWICVVSEEGCASRKCRSPVLLH